MNQYLTKNTKEDCCGCTACAMVCPTKAIVMVSDEEGYLYPSLNCELCVGCAQCEQVCPMMNRQEGSCIEIIAAKARDDNVRLASTSGGIFPILANSVLAQGGMVAGVVFDDQFSVIHILSDKGADIRRMCGSKYVQSRLDNLFAEILKQINARKVLFTGTPCQCEGLRRFIRAKNGNIDNLIICDLICGKVPSPGVWSNYVNYLQTHFLGHITDFVFRSKIKGWQYPYCKVSIDGKDVSGLVDKSCTWMQIYTSPALCRHSCYVCPFTTVNRKSDITIGDYWGVEKSLPDFTDNTGISLVLVHTDKGKELIRNVETFVLCKESNSTDCLQDRLKKPTPQPEHREKFWELYKINGIDEIVKKYGKRNLFMRFVYKDFLPFSRKIKLYDRILDLFHAIKR